MRDERGHAFYEEIGRKGGQKVRELIERGKSAAEPCQPEARQPASGDNAVRGPAPLRRARTAWAGGAAARKRTHGAAAPILEIDPLHPQPRVVERAVSVLSSGGLLAFPTDTYYGIGCDLFDKRAIERIYQLKQLPRTHELSFICQDLAEISRYALVDNAAYRVLRRKVPGPFTFILPATRLVPDLVLRRQKTVGIRIPDSPIALEIVRLLGHPLISTSAATPDGEVLIDARDIKEQLGHGLELVLDGGYRPNEPSSVIDLSGPRAGGAPRRARATSPT